MRKKMLSVKKRKRIKNKKQMIRERDESCQMNGVE